ncbi:MAG: hypothetical protein KA746_10325 [Pyrinomonadaceae bacterium]|nr:hypothetical protein [Pyrinomonadaceae bacterium]MBP6213639.1 hypothetical protein [Pyrinomonadaceae bacterium]
MAQKTSGEFEKEFMDGLEGLTGKSLSTWLGIVDGIGTKKRNEVIERLKADHGFNHMQASLLAGIHANGGKPVYQSADGLLDAQFGKNEDIRPLYDEFAAFIATNFPNATLLPKKTYISVLENREFGAVNIKKGELRIGLDLGDRPFDEDVQKAKLIGPMPRISHMIVATDSRIFDNSLVQLLRQSHGRCHK